MLHIIIMSIQFNKYKNQINKTLKIVKFGFDRSCLNTFDIIS